MCGCCLCVCASVIVLLGKGHMLRLNNKEACKGYSGLGLVKTEMCLDLFVCVCKCLCPAIITY